MIFGEKMDQSFNARLTKSNMERIKHIAEVEHRSVNYMINTLIEEEHWRRCDRISELTGKAVPVTGDIWY